MLFNKFNITYCEYLFIFVHCNGDPASDYLSVVTWFLYLNFTGSYFCYDTPAALADNFKDDTHLNTSKFTLLYSIYSWPNVILCFIGGYLIDRWVQCLFGYNNTLYSMTHCTVPIYVMNTCCCHVCRDIWLYLHFILIPNNEVLSYILCVAYYSLSISLLQQSNLFHKYCNN